MKLVPKCIIAVYEESGSLQLPAVACDPECVCIGNKSSHSRTTADLYMLSSPVRKLVRQQVHNLL